MKFEGCYARTLRWASPAKLLSRSPRPLSAAGIVATDRDPIFVKRHHSTVRDAEGLREEHRFMAHLRSNGMTVPQVFATDRRDTAIQLGEWTYEIHEVATGIDLYKDAISWTPFRSIGACTCCGAGTGATVTCRLQATTPRLAGTGNWLRGSPSMLRRDPGEEFDRYVESRPALRNYLHTRTCRNEALALLAPFHAELQPLLPSLAPLWTHNDWHASNLLWSDAGANAGLSR